MCRIPFTVTVKVLCKSWNQKVFLKLLRQNLLISNEMKTGEAKT